MDAHGSALPRRRAGRPRPPPAQVARTRPPAVPAWLFRAPGLRSRQHGRAAASSRPNGMTVTERPAQASVAGDGSDARDTAAVAEPNDAADQLSRWLSGRLPKLLGASTLTGILATAAYQYHTGFRQGWADRLGI